MEDTILQILGQLYEWKYETEEYDSKTVKEYYEFLSDALGLGTELEKIHIKNPVELQDKLLSREYKI